MSYDAFDVVRVPFPFPFPFADRHATKRRPALVLSDKAPFNAPAGHSVMAMITSSRHPSWPLDCSIDNLDAAGLPVASVVRFKLFTLDHRLVHSALGRLDDPDKKRVAEKLRKLLETMYIA